MSAQLRSWVAALTIAFAITVAAVAAVATAAVERRDANPTAVSSATPGKTISGTPSNEVLSGSTGDDVIDGGAGDDVIDGGLGNDFLVEGGTGDERIDGGIGDDVIDGGAGNDMDLSGGIGQDIVFGGRGDDVADGGLGNDRIDAGGGADTVRGGEGDDVLLGGADRDALDGGSGDDVLIGGGSDDTLDGGLGNDVCYTDATVLEITIGCETEVKIGVTGASRDLIDELHPGIATGKSVLAKLLANREPPQRKHVSGTDGPDALVGTDAAEAFKTAGGDDTVSALGGDDDLDCGAGNDNCLGGAGDDNLVGGPGDDRLAGDDGNDVVEGGPGADKIVAGAGDDTIFPGDGDELRPAGVAAGASVDKAVDAGPGNDRIYVAGGGADAVECGDGDDMVQYDSTDTIASDCERRAVPLVVSTSRTLSLSLSAQRIRGDVLIRKPNTSEFVPLKRDEPIPVNSALDTQGTSQVTISADVAEGTQSTRATASISSGTAKILGPSKDYPDKLAIRPISRTSQRCGRIVAAAAQAGDTRRRKPTKPKRAAVMRTKLEKVDGRVEAITRDVVAAAVHTSWTTTQTCTGTRVSVIEGVVKVFDRGRRKTSLVSAGKPYFAKRPRR